MASFEDVKRMLTELELPIVSEDLYAELVVVTDENEGICNLVVDCEDSIIVLEQLVMDVTDKTDFVKLMQINRSLAFGAFALNEDCTKVILRNTLALEHLDLNELQTTIDSFSLALRDNCRELLAMQ